MMSHSTRFHTPISTTRPRNARMIEAYSPKLNRRIQCFGQEAFHLWICLEADPLIATFCERPAFLGSGDNKRIADFWVYQQEREQLLIIDEQQKPSTLTIGDAELPVRTILPIELAVGSP